MNIFRPSVILIGLIGLWQTVVSLSGAPPYILPSPLAVAQAWITRPDLFIRHGAITMAEILLGLTFGLVLGIASALVMAYFRPARQWLMPVLVVSQAVPVFALAPILVLWVGYGMASKVVMATLIIYFPVTAAFDTAAGSAAAEVAVTVHSAACGDTARPEVSWSLVRKVLTRSSVKAMLAPPC